MLYQPCAFELGDITGPYDNPKIAKLNLMTLEALATSQSYDYTEFTNTVGARPTHALPATLENFALLAQAGIFQIATHASPKWLLVECYPREGVPGVDDDNDGTVDETDQIGEDDNNNGRVDEQEEWGIDEGKAARDARLAQICAGGSVPGLSCGNDKDVFSFSGMGDFHSGARIVNRPTDWGIGLSRSGIAKLLPPQAHRIAIVDGCKSFDLKSGFDPESEMEFFGYKALIYKDRYTIPKDASLLFQRLAGTDGGGRHRPVAKLSCTAMGKGGYSSFWQHAGPGNTTVAPIVRWEDRLLCLGGEPDFRPEDHDYSFIGEAVDPSGRVVFDTVMDTSIDPTLVVTTDGGCGSTLEDMTWVDNHTISFCIRLTASGEARLTVNKAAAISGHNGRQLDGKAGVGAKSPNGVGPNRDDYIAKITCTRIGEPQLRPRSSEPALARVHVDTVAAIAGIAIGAPGDTATTTLHLSSEAAASEVVVSWTDLSSGSSTVPSYSVFIDPDTLDIPSQGAHNATVSIEIPPGQASGLYEGTITVTNGGLATTTPLNLVVNTPPVLMVPAPATTAVGDSLVLAISATDADGDSIRLTTDLLPDGAHLVDNMDGTGYLVFVPAYASAGLDVSVAVTAYNPTDLLVEPSQDTEGVEIVVDPLPVAVSRATTERNRVLQLWTGVPNPFHAQTQLRYRTARPGWVRLSVHDVSGRLIALLVSAPRPAGDFSIEWDARDLNGRRVPSGHYLVRATLDQEVQSVGLIVSN